MGFKWTPGLGPSKRSLAVMRANSLKPDYPMGEGWFLAENRLMYTEGTSEKPPILGMI